jgi:serine/threonine protein kinase
MIEISKALKYLHSKNILHRDLKIENILVKSILDKDKNFKKYQPKITDFGFSKLFGE